MNCALTLPAAAWQHALPPYYRPCRLPPLFAEADLEFVVRSVCMVPEPLREALPDAVRLPSACALDSSRAEFQLTPLPPFRTAFA